MSKMILKVIVFIMSVIIGCCAFNYSVNTANSYMSSMSKQMTSMFKVGK